MGLCMDVSTRVCACLGFLVCVCVHGSPRADPECGLPRAGILCSLDYMTPKTPSGSGAPSASGGLPRGLTCPLPCWAQPTKTPSTLSPTSLGPAQMAMHLSLQVRSSPEGPSQPRTGAVRALLEAFQWGRRVRLILFSLGVHFWMSCRWNSHPFSAQANWEEGAVLPRMQVTPFHRLPLGQRAALQVSI